MTNMTLNLAHNFLNLSFVIRAKVLKDLGLLDADEASKLHISNHAEVMEIYRKAFRRANERKQVKALEKAVANARTF